MLNNQTALHMAEWIDRWIPECDRDVTINAMLAFLDEYPDLLNSRTWTEIHELAMRRVAV